MELAEHMYLIRIQSVNDVVMIYGMVKSSVNTVEGKQRLMQNIASIVGSAYSMTTIQLMIETAKILKLYSIVEDAEISNGLIKEEV